MSNRNNLRVFNFLFSFDGIYLRCFRRSLLRYVTKSMLSFEILTVSNDSPYPKYQRVRIFCTWTTKRVFTHQIDSLHQSYRKRSNSFSKERWQDMTFGLPYICFNSHHKAKQLLSNRCFKTTFQLMRYKTYFPIWKFKVSSLYYPMGPRSYQFWH